MFGAGAAADAADAGGGVSAGAAAAGGAGVSGAEGAGCATVCCSTIVAARRDRVWKNTMPATTARSAATAPPMIGHGGDVDFCVWFGFAPSAFAGAAAGFAALAGAGTAAIGAASDIGGAPGSTFMAGRISVFMSTDTAAPEGSGVGGTTAAGTADEGIFAEGQFAPLRVVADVAPLRNVRAPDSRSRFTRCRSARMSAAVW